MMRVRVRFYGVLKTAAKTDGLELDSDAAVTVGELVNKLLSVISHPEFERHLIDPDLKDPRPNALILISGTEIGALKGMDTMLRDGDEVVFLPVAHGG